MSKQLMINQDGSWECDSFGMWSMAVPEPYHRSWIFFKPFRCSCGQKFHSKGHYKLHYIHNHTDGKRYKRTPKGLVEL